MDVLMQSISDFKENSLKLNDLKNQQKTTSDRIDHFFEQIWYVFNAAKLTAVPDNGWFRFRYKGFKIKGNSVRIIGHAPDCAVLDDRSITIPLQIVKNGPASVGSFIAHKVVKDLIEAEARQEREDMEKFAKHMQKTLDDSIFNVLTAPMTPILNPLPNGDLFFRFR